MTFPDLPVATTYCAIRKAFAMNYINLATAALLSITAGTALAQAPSFDVLTGARPGHVPGVGDSLPQSDKASNIQTSSNRADVAPTLPKSGLGENAEAMEYLKVARTALVAGRSGQAQQSLEMAETRMLDRSVPEGQTNVPIENVTVAEVRDARLALGRGDRTQAIALIDVVLAR